MTPEELPDSIVVDVLEAVKEALEDGAEHLQDNVAVKTGELRDSITVEGNAIVAVDYAVYAVPEQIEQTADYIVDTFTVEQD